MERIEEYWGMITGYLGTWTFDEKCAFAIGVIVGIACLAFTVGIVDEIEHAVKKHKAKKLGIEYEEE